MFSGFWCALGLTVCLWLRGWHFWEDLSFLIFCSLGVSEVTGVLLALSPCVGKAKLAELELEYFFFFFNSRKKCTINTLRSSQAQTVTAITGNWWNKLFGNLFIINISCLFVPNTWGKETLTCNQVAVHWTSYHQVSWFSLPPPCPLFFFSLLLSHFFTLSCTLVATH